MPHEYKLHHCNAETLWNCAYCLKLTIDQIVGRWFLKYDLMITKMNLPAVASRPSLMRAIIEAHSEIQTFPTKLAVSRSTVSWHKMKTMHKWVHISWLIADYTVDTWGNLIIYFRSDTFLNRVIIAHENYFVLFFQVCAAGYLEREIGPPSSNSNQFRHLHLRRITQPPITKLMNKN